jgi:hypothetical protein
MKRVINILLFLIIHGGICVSAAEADRMYLIISDHDIGAVNEDDRKPGIIEFRRNNDGAYRFSGFIQYFKGGNESIHLQPLNQIILIENNDSSQYGIINTKYPEKRLNYKMETYTRFSVSFDESDSLMLYKLKGTGHIVSLYNTLSGVESIIDPSSWESTLGSETFYITDALRFSRVGMDQKVYLKKPPDNFCMLPENKKYVLANPPNLLPIDKIWTLSRLSVGKNNIYFRCDTPEGAGARLWIYNKMDESWKSDSLAGDNCELHGFQDNFAVRHAICSSNKHGNQTLYDGYWSIYIRGKKQTAFLGWDSNVLYCSKDRIIFCDSNRLYECPIVRDLIQLDRMEKIAEDNNIRYASAAFLGEAKETRASDEN